MKVSEFRKLIREEVRKVLKEADTDATALIFDEKTKKFSQLDLKSFLSKYAKRIYAVMGDHKLSTAQVTTWPQISKSPEFVKAISLLSKTSNFYPIGVHGYEVIAAIPKGENMNTYTGGSAGAVSAEEMKDGIGLPYDNGKMAAAFVKLATNMGLKQGTWNNGTANGDYSFDFEMGDASDAKEMVSDKGVGIKSKNNPSAIFILNPKMQRDPAIQKLVQKAIEQYD
mgnify:CR=1 FL=1